MPLEIQIIKVFKKMVQYLKKQEWFCRNLIFITAVKKDLYLVGFQYLRNANVYLESTGRINAVS